MLFADGGLSTAQISSLFVLWSVVGLGAEVPSGVLADLTSRRRLLLVAALVQGAGFGAWTLGAGYPAFALGFVLWGLGGALVSGAYEAYVHDSLAARGATTRYPQVIAWGRALGLACNLGATLLAAPLLALGGFAAVGLASVAACLLQAAVAASLPPEERPPDTVDDDEDGEASFLEVLRAGVAEVRGEVRVRHAVALAAVLPAFLIFDEYAGLLAEDLGASRASLPVIVAVVVAGQALGALLAGRCPPRLAAPALVLAAVLLVGGIALGVPAGVVPIAAGYGLAQMAIVVAEARLQAAIDGRARATTTSMAGLLSEVLNIALLVAIGLASIRWSLPVVMLLLVGLLLPAAVLTRRWLRWGS